MSIFQFLLSSLAVWRIASLFVYEEGPFFIFKRFRDASGIHGDMIPETFWAQLLSCIWCCSVWVGFGWFCLWKLFPIESYLLSLPLAFSAMAIFIEKLVVKR